MKKHLLLSALSIGVALSSYADNGVPTEGGTSTTENLKLEWYGVPTGNGAVSLNGRSGIGVNGKFYVVCYNEGVQVYDQNGLKKMIANPTTWVSINCDDAGNVYFRNDKGGWAGPDGKGNYISEKAQFCVIDSKTDEIVKADVPMNSTVSCRFDALPHVRGNMLEDFVNIYTVASAAGGNVLNFMYTAGLKPSGDEQFNIGDAITKAGFPAPDNVLQTLGSVQAYGANGTEIAAYGNPHMEITSWMNGWGNGIAKYTFDPKKASYTFTGKYFNLPNHSSVGGFMIFSYKEKNYILYPAGMFSIDNPSGDGFFVMPEELVDSPRNLKEGDEGYSVESNKVELKKAVAYKYATSDIPSGNNWRGLNVEPIDGQDGKFRIYLYDPNKSMQVWILDMEAAEAGIEDIVTDEDDVKIFGGKGEVIIEGADFAQVYSMSGTLVKEGKGYLAVAPGLYIVKAGNKSAKIIVK